MVESLANTFLETLRELLAEETKMLLSVSGEVEKVKRDLRSIHAVLMKADRERSGSPTLKDYVAQLQDLAFQAENLLETYAVDFESNKEAQRLKDKFQRYVCLLCQCCSSRRLGKQARDIISRVADLTKDLESEFGQQGSSSSSPEQENNVLRQTYAHEAEPHFVGMEKDVEDLITMVKDENKSRRVVKIYGMGGLGKTTLARKIYNHADVASYGRAWVCLTQQFQARSILGKILEQLDEDAQIDGMDVDKLVKGIHSRLLHRKKCLVVIDDIWQNDHWDIIKPAFPMEAVVLFTTRLKNIANQESHPYELQLLTEDQGWELLQKIALPKDFAPPDDTGLKSLEDIGRRMVRKCGRLPLSICVIGGILSQKREHGIAEWRKVYMKMDSYVRHGEGVEENKRVKEVLELSYNALPYYLKPCFLYLACFPEDEDIRTQKLYFLWIAEGFISYEDKGRNESLRDVAERYLTELVARCMVQVPGESTTLLEKFYSCQLHDLMHELCSSKVEKEKFLKRIEISKYQDEIPSQIGTSVIRVAIPSSIGSSISRLAIVNDTYTNTSGLSIQGLKEVRDIRSLQLFKAVGVLDDSNLISFEDTAVNFETSPFLRILVVDGCAFEGEKLPSSVGKLIHLRYLSLNNSCMRELPQFVCRMAYLQILDLRVSGSIRLHNVIWKMKRLMHLFLNSDVEVIGEEKLRLDGLEELETLEEINSMTARITDIPKLKNLHKLSVTVDDVDSMSTVLQHLKSRSSCETHLQVEECDLTVEMCRDVFNNLLASPSLFTLSLSSCTVSGGFPQYKQGMCRNLVELTLSDCKVGGEDVDVNVNVNVNVNVMDELGNYPILQSLILKAVEFAKAETFVCPSNSFPHLERLFLIDLQDLKEWEVKEGAMPKLAYLVIQNCSNLEKVPDGLRLISTIRELHIHHMPQEFKERIRGQDSAIVSHIPSIHISDY